MAFIGIDSADSSRAAGLAFLRSTPVGYPSYYDYNVLWVEGDPGLSADELVAAADEALAGLEHRRIDFARAEAGDHVRPPSLL